MYLFTKIVYIYVKYQPKQADVSKDGNYNLESVYTSKVKAGKRRTYFFDVRQTKGNDYYITLTESTKRFNGDGTERHKIFVYKEDFNRFLGGLTEAIDHVKNELMPDYDYEQYERRHEEWEKELSQSENKTTNIEVSSNQTEKTDFDASDVSEEDVSW